LVSVGANQFLKVKQAPLSTCQVALEKIREAGIVVLQKSSWYLSSPVPADCQPWYINGVLSVGSDLQPNGLLMKLLAIEEELGRLSFCRGGSRTIDLDLLAYGEKVCKDQGKPMLTLPHPRMNERNFIMYPLSDILPEWLHPVLGVRARDLAAVKRNGQNLVRLSSQSLEF
jgi:2-amino-4-hydroxy-6-hydroxymethyldihydropteridine diphosphokinase